MQKQTGLEFPYLLFVMVIAAAVRLSAPLASSFPLNDGGLFYQMIEDLLNNHYLLPVFTTYNHATLPFAYPPLAFYLYAALHQASGIPVLKLMQYLPAIVSTLTVLAFYFLAHDLLKNKTQAFLASLVFALIPRAFDWVIMGGGVTRSLGLLLALLAIRQIHVLFTKPTRRSLLLAIVLNTLVVCTHPEATIHTAIASAILFVWKDRSIQGAYRAAIAAAGTALLSAPWWGSVLVQHGFSPFHAALTVEGQDSLTFPIRIAALIKFDLTDEPFLQILAVTGLIGIFILLAQRKYALPVWFVLMGLLEPRGGALYMMIPLALFAGVALDQVIPPSITLSGEKARAWTYIALIGFFLLYGIIDATSVTSIISQQITLTEEDRTAFVWVRTNTPTNSRFLLVTQGLPLNDAASEWFPALTGRVSVATVFGYEWVDDGRFGQRERAYEALQSCAAQGLACLAAWEQDNVSNASYVYIWVSKDRVHERPLLLSQLEDYNNYQIIYQTETVEIFAKKTSSESQ